jgi:type II secretory pathway component GspD/PulD (secretin)
MVLMMFGTAVQAQEPEIADQDLLDLLVEVKQSPDASATNALDTAATNSADEAEADVVDDVGMDVFEGADASSMGSLISVRLNKVGLEEAINLFAQLSGANIIVPELEETAQISVNLKDVEWRPALQSILDTYNYELYQKVAGSNVFSVRRRPPGAPEPQVVETFILKYTTVPLAAELVRGLLPAEAKVSEFASRNMIVVKSSESSLGEVRAVLDTIDTVRQQVFIESKFMELTDDAQKDLGIDWTVLQAYSAGTAGATTRDYQRSITDQSKEYRFTDISGNQYEEASGYNETQRGGSSLAPWTLGGVTPTLENMNIDGTSEVLSSVLSADQFRMVLSALEHNKGVNVVSNPKVIVANEEKANISIVRREPNLKQERQQTAGAAGGAAIDNTVFSLDSEQPFFDFGIKLDVIPSVNTSSNITVQINPSLTRKFADKDAGENTYPVIDEKSIQTVFNLASGQTAAIGGLTEITESEEEKKVPLLGDIPFLGRLFSWKETIRGQDETIIFVTVGLANTEDLERETGMPGDSELARRQLIQDENSRTLRDQGRVYYKIQEDEKLKDSLKLLRIREDERQEKRRRELQKEQDKAAKQSVEAPAEPNEIASIN